MNKCAYFDYDRAKELQRRIPRVFRHKHDIYDEEELWSMYEEENNLLTHKATYFERLQCELALVACHPDRYWDWCLGEDEKKERKAQKKAILNDLLPIAWHPYRYWDWCVPDDEKRVIEKLWN